MEVREHFNTKTREHFNTKMQARNISTPRYRQEDLVSTNALYAAVDNSMYYIAESI